MPELRQESLQEYAGTTAVQNVKAAANAPAAGKKKYFRDSKFFIKANGKEFDTAEAQVK